jgi:hypothetical protein
MEWLQTEDSSLNPRSSSKKRWSKGGNLHKRPRRGQLTQQQETDNMAVKQRRLVVENTIAQLRNCNIVSGKYRCKNPESADVSQFFYQTASVLSAFL